MQWHWINIGLDPNSVWLVQHVHLGAGYTTSILVSPCFSYMLAHHFSMLWPRCVLHSVPQTKWLWFPVSHGQTLVAVELALSTHSHGTIFKLTPLKHKNKIKKKTLQENLCVRNKKHVVSCISFPNPLNIRSVGWTFTHARRLNPQFQLLRIPSCNMCKTRMNHH